jgi:NADH dehydrogenase/NADH:ubiquinone oxidoreductase subunit G
MLWNLSVLSGARVVPLAAVNNERGSFELRRGLGETRAVGDAGWTGKKALYVAGEVPLAGGKPAGFIVFQGSYFNDCARAADVVLPAAVFAETSGTYVNLEGRIQHSTAALPPAGESRPDWWITAELARRLGKRNFGYAGPDEIARELAAAVPALAEAAASRKTGKPVFIAENPSRIRRLLPAPAGMEKAGAPAAVPGPSSDVYRGLDLALEVKGLRKLRTRTEGRHG